MSIASKFCYKEWTRYQWIKSVQDKVQVSAAWINEVGNLPGISHRTQKKKIKQSASATSEKLWLSDF